MDLFQSFFAANETVLYFVYGQVYFLLAVSIVLRAQSQSRLEIARALPLLTAFGLTQALVKWGNVFIPIQAEYASPSLFSIMRLVQLFILGLSFTFLFAFGLRLLSPRRLSEQLVRWLPVIIYVGWGSAIVVVRVFNLASIDDLIPTADVISRYLLALPGGLLAAAGLRRQAQGAIGAMGVPTIVSFLRAAGIALVVYAFLAGLLGPSAPFFPAQWLNEETIQDLLNVPAALFRALVGLALTYSILQALQVFQVETNHWIEEMERAQVQLDRAMASLNRTIQDIRSYIFDLRRGEAVEDIESSLSRLIKDFRVNTLIEVDFSVEGKTAQSLEPDRAQNLYQIAREALTNVARHAQARHVDVLLRYGERQLTLRIADDGIGFPASGVNGAGRGLKNMRERAQLLEGALVVEGTPSEGVTVVLTMPFGDGPRREGWVAS